MNGILRIPTSVHTALLADLRRPHEFAAERVAFARVRLGNRSHETPIALVSDFWSVPDDQYVDDPRSGARINGTAIRGAMQTVLSDGVGILHIHLHEFRGRPGFGHMDRAEIPRLVESLRGTDPTRVHGMLVLSPDSAEAWLAFPGCELEPVAKVAIVGRPMTIIGRARSATTERFRRQSFLGPHSEEVFSNVRIGVIGVSGGGSHVVQQTAHVGFLDYALFDGQRIDESNLNRWVGATEAEVAAGRLKVEIAARAIRGIRSRAIVQAIPARWQDSPEIFRTCDVIFGCVDGFAERHQIETSCRRYLIPYIDIGMDVRVVRGQAPRMAGQIILSTPGGLCMQCIGFLNERTLAQEAQNYGDAGDHPQVVWANGVLASTAVGLGVDLVTGWTGRTAMVEYLSFDGNTGTVSPHVRLVHLQDGSCHHHSQEGAGDPL